MNITRYYFFFAVSTFLFSNCEGQAVKPQVLHADKFEIKLNSETEKIVLDVRTPGEYAAGHLKSAILIDYYRNDFEQQLEKLDKDKPVFVYCAVGGRSGSASAMLTRLGFKQVYDLQGGINAWLAAGKPVIKK
jgi:rhodanese-related sulfurtransferase